MKTQNTSEKATGLRAVVLSAADFSTIVNRLREDGEPMSRLLAENLQDRSRALAARRQYVMTLGSSDVARIDCVLTDCCCKDCLHAFHALEAAGLL